LTLNIDQGRKVFAFGETVYDIVLEDGIPVSGCAGGAMLNTSVSLGRLGIAVFLVGTVGDDLVGENIRAFLHRNHVDTTCLQVRKGKKTSLALAFLDQAKEASYQFYKDDPFPRGMTIDIPPAGPRDIFLFGSYYSIMPETSEQVRNLIRRAKSASSMIIYDPNFRTAHLSKLEELLPAVIRNISSADLVRGSADDFLNLFGSSDPDFVYNHLVDVGCKHLIYTMGGDGIYYIYPGGRKFFRTKSVKPVSTVGAGDSFNAGLISGIFAEGITGMEMIQQDPGGLSRPIKQGIEFGRRVCKSLQNYIPKSYADKITIC